MILMLRMTRAAIVVCVLGVAPASAQPPAASTALGAVARIYQDFAAEAVIDTPELSVLDLFGRPKAAMARYLDDPLVALVLADRECSRRTQGVARSTSRRSGMHRIRSVPPSRCRQARTRAACWPKSAIRRTSSGG